MKVLKHDKISAKVKLFEKFISSKNKKWQPPWKMVEDPEQSHGLG